MFINIFKYLDNGYRRPQRYSHVTKHSSFSRNKSYSHRNYQNNNSFRGCRIIVK